MYNSSISNNQSPLESLPFSLAQSSPMDHKLLEGGYSSDDSSISNCSTNNSLNCSPLADRHMKPEENRINMYCVSSQDNSRKNSEERAVSELQALLEAEDELKSIWSKKPVNANVKTISSNSYALQPQNRLRKSEGCGNNT